MDRQKTALAYFEEGYNCAQAVLLTFGQELGLEREQCLLKASGFGGGIGRLGSACGAVTGGTMVLGLMFGYTNTEDKPAKGKTISTVQRMAKEFAEEFKTVNCKELLGCDIGKEAGMKEAQDKNLFKTNCPLFVAKATEIIEVILNDSKEVQ